MPGSGYKPILSIKKFFTGLAYAAIPFILLYSINFLETEELPPEYAAYSAIGVGIIHLILNAWKHWTDEE